MKHIPVSRRGFLQIGSGLAVGAALSSASARADGVERPRAVRRPVIDITDLYHPHQDRGDNFDLIAAYALPEVDLRAVILDVTGRYLRPYINEADPGYNDPRGKRAPGFIPVHQLNYIFDLNVPCACAPFEPMRSPGDDMADAPRFQQGGIDLLIETLRESNEPVDVVSFGSARPLAVALNREPELLREKVRLAHLCIGGYPPGYLEWNVQLDVHAYVRLIRSDLPLALYPCATEESPFALGTHNCYWTMETLNWVREMAPPLQRYIEFAFGGSTRMDFLNAMDETEPLTDMTEFYGHKHHVWETAVWAQVAERRFVAREGEPYRLLPKSSAGFGTSEIEEGLMPCVFEVSDEGQLTMRATAGKTTASLYFRPDPIAYEAAAGQALRDLYIGFAAD
ncbi:MAG: hypothetical protein KJ060_18095 [Candidatus Hydrogenedentes bacterium]|nr:hypothetical protein [Candidatus Hydrogenedentota bacterium]